MIKFGATINTAGDGYWSSRAKAVQLTRIDVGYINDEEDFGELCVFFDESTWNVEKDGLIYTDSQFLAELRTALASAGFGQEAAGDVDYSEQGMQGDSYVSLDVGEKFIRKWLDIVGIQAV